MTYRFVSINSTPGARVRSGFTPSQMADFKTRMAPFLAQGLDQGVARDLYKQEKANKQQRAALLTTGQQQPKTPFIGPRRGPVMPTMDWLATSKGNQTPVHSSRYSSLLSKIPYPTSTFYAPHREDHSDVGNETGGGHSYGANQDPLKSKMPEGASRDELINAGLDVVRDPAKSWQQGNRIMSEGVRFVRGDKGVHAALFENPLERWGEIVSTVPTAHVPVRPVRTVKRRSALTVRIARQRAMARLAARRTAPTET